MQGYSLELKLQEVLLKHHSGSGRERVPASDEDPTISYIRNFLLHDDEEDQFVEQDVALEHYLNDLSSIVRDASCSLPDQSSSSVPGQGSCFPDLSLRLRLDPAFVDPLSSASSEEDLTGECSDIIGYRSQVLMRAARAVAANDPSQALKLIQDLSHQLSPLSSNPRERSIFYFTQALIARLSGNGAEMHKAIAAGISTRAYLEVRLLKLPAFEVMHVYSMEVILERCKGAKILHIADFGILYGSQWPSLLKALSELPGGPPSLKITGIDYPDRVDVVATGRKLAGFARMFGLSLEFHAIAVHRWETVQLQCCPEEFLVVNFNLRLRHVPEDGTVANNPRKLLFQRIARHKPQMLLLCHASASLSLPFFLPRFREAFRYYTAKIEYFDTVTGDESAKALMEKIISRNIMNVVACEGKDRIEQLNSYENWESRVRQAGFKALPLSDNVCDKMQNVWNGYQHSKHIGFGRDREWILLQWKDVNFYAFSAWEPIALF